MLKVLFLTEPINHSLTDVLLTIAGKEGYYFTFDLKITDKNGNTTYTGQFIAGEDSDCTKFLLSWDMYMLCGEPPTESATGNGFNCVISHLKLEDDDLEFQYKIHGLEMDWQTFKPIFLSAPDPTADNDLANLSTWGWQPQASLLSHNIGIVSVGLEKYIVGSAEVGADVMMRLLK